MNNLAEEYKKIKSLKHNVNQLNQYSSPDLLLSFFFSETQKTCKISHEWEKTVTSVVATQ